MGVCWPTCSRCGTGPADIPARSGRRPCTRSILLLATSGLRISEALHLTLRDVDLAGGGRRMRRAAATVGSLEQLAAAAGYQVESSGELPLLRYVLAVRPEDQARP
jgi:integrase